MSQTGLAVFDTTLQKTHLWLREIMNEMNWDDEHRAYLALRAVLQTLRDRLNVDEAAHLGAQLPMLIRGIYFEGWKPSETPRRERILEQFLDRIRAHFVNEIAPADQIACAVFRVLSHR